LGQDVEVVRIRSGSGQMMSIPIASLPSYLSAKSPEEVQQVRKQLEKGSAVESSSRRKNFVREEAIRRPFRIEAGESIEEAVRRRVRRPRTRAELSSPRRSLSLGQDVEVVRIRSGSGQMMSIPIASLPSYLSSKSPEESQTIQKRVSYARTQTKRVRVSPGLVSSIRRILKKTKLTSDMQVRVVSIIEEDAQEAIAVLSENPIQKLLPLEVKKAIVVQLKQVVRQQKKVQRARTLERKTTRLRSVSSIMRQAKRIQTQAVRTQELVQKEKTSEQNISRITSSPQSRVIQTPQMVQKRQLVSRSAGTEDSSRSIRYVSPQTDAMYPVVKKPSSVEKKALVKKKKIKKERKEREKKKGKYGPTPAQKKQSWSVADEVLEEVLQEKPVPQVVQKEQSSQKANNNEKKARRKVNKNISEELLLEVLHELTEDTPEARQLLSEISVKVEFLKKIDDLRKI
jgi:hypothetical protein